MAGADPGSLFAEPHRRWDPLRGEWVLVSPGRTERPWQGSPTYEHTYVLMNDFAALRPTTSDATWEAGDGLFRAEGERGTCRVLCFSPRHDLSLGAMAPAEVRRVVDVWADQTAELGETWRWVQVFENRGVAMGASNPHPHGHIWAGAALPGAPAREDETQRAHRARAGRPLLLDVADAEADGPRVIEASERWLAIVPFWAVWPFEALVLPRFAVARLPDLDPAARDELAVLLVRLVGRYDRLFDVPFPYSMGWHGAPFEPDAATDAWQLHGHAYPPLLRSASVRTFMVGYELLAEPQRDLLPEEAAERLRTVAI